MGGGAGGGNGNGNGGGIGGGEGGRNVRLHCRCRRRERDRARRDSAGNRLISEIIVASSSVAGKLLLGAIRRIASSLLLCIVDGSLRLDAKLVLLELALDRAAVAVDDLKVWRRLKLR